MVLILLMSCVTGTQLTWSSFCFNGHSRICTHPSRHKMKSRKNNLGKRFDIFHGHPSIQGQKEIKEKNNLCQGLKQVSHGHSSIQGQRKSKKKTIFAKVLIQVSHGHLSIHQSHLHPSIPWQRKARKNNFMQRFDNFHTKDSSLAFQCFVPYCTWHVTITYSEHSTMTMWPDFCW